MFPSFLFISNHFPNGDDIILLHRAPAQSEFDRLRSTKVSISKILCLLEPVGALICEFGKNKLLTRIQANTRHNFRNINGNIKISNIERVRNMYGFWTYWNSQFLNLRTLKIRNLENFQSWTFWTFGTLKLWSFGTLKTLKLWVE